MNCLMVLVWHLTDIIISIPFSYGDSLVKSCAYGKYRIQNSPCMLWDTCPEGLGMDKLWQNEYESYEDLPTCVDCIDGVTYSEHDSSSMCEPCGEPCTKGLNLNETKSCMRNHNRECQCKRGMFEGPHGLCTQQCCTCGAGTHFHQKCLLDGLPTSMCCHPTNEDGTCNDAAVTPTTNAGKILGSVTTATKNIDTTKEGTKTPINSSNNNVPSNQNNELTVPLAILGTIAFIIIAVPVLYFRKNWWNNTANPASIQLLSPADEAVPSRKANLASIQLLSPEDEAVPSQKASTESSSSGNTNLACSMQSLPQDSGNSSSLTEKNNFQKGVEEPPIYESIDGEGLLLKDLSYCERMEIARILDHREDGNWQDVGMHFAGTDGDFIDDIRKCHQCFYGGGEQMLLVFQQLSLKEPDFLVKKFVEISHSLGRSDVVSYIIENELLGQKLNDVSHRHQNKIAIKLDKRVDADKGHYWPSFASKLGFTCDQIEKIKTNLHASQDCSPTYAMIGILITRLPKMTIKEFQKAVVYYGIEEVDKYLADTFADRKRDSVPV